MRAKKRIFLPVLAALLALLMFGSCGEKDKKEPQASDSMQSDPGGEPVSLAAGEYNDGIWRYHETVDVRAYACYNDDRITHEDAQDWWLFEWTRDKMNIDFSIEAFGYSSLDELTAGMFMSGNLPDCFIHWQKIYEERATFGDEDHTILPLNKYMYDEELSPNMQKLVADPTFAQLGTYQGNIYSWPRILNSREYNQSTANKEGIWYNKADLAETGKPEPKTVEELIEVLEILKENPPARMQGDSQYVPLGGKDSDTGTNTSWFGPFHYALGLNMTNTRWDHTVTRGSYEDGELLYYWTSDEYRYFLELASDMYSKGLCEKAFYEMDGSEVMSKMLDNKYSFVFGLLETGRPDYEDWDVLPPMTSKISDKPMATKSVSITNFWSCFVTPQTDDESIEAIVRWMDLAYNPEYAYCYFWGPYGGDENKAADDNYGVDNGRFRGWKWDKTGSVRMWTQCEDIEKGNGLDPIYDTAQTKAAMVGPFANSGGSLYRVTDGSDLRAVMAQDTQNGYIARKSDEKFNHIGEYMLPSYKDLCVSDDVMALESYFEDPASEFGDEQRAAFITGKRELTDAEWSKYISELNAFGFDIYWEKITGIYKRAYPDIF